MPLLHGKQNIGKNITEMTTKYKRTGKIGHVAPKTLAKARRVALAAALNTAYGPKKK